jgi:uncharacterized protein (DUF1015 family)
VPRISPFTGLLFDPARVGSLGHVTSPPYDTIAPDQERRLHELSPYNAVRLILGREQAKDDGTRNKYTRASEMLRQWKEEGVLRPTRRPAWYPYEMRFSHLGRPRRVRGLIAEVELEEWGGSIHPHERTMSAPVEDRLALLRAVRANLSPIYALYRGPSRELATWLDEVTTSGASVGEVTDEAGVEHRMWMDEGGDDITAWLADEDLLIADGHHRYTVALMYRDEMRAQLGPGPWDRMMMLLVDAGAEDPPVLPIHRMVHSGSAPTAGRRVRDLAEVLSSLHDEDLTYGTAAVEDGRLIHRVAKAQGDPPTVCALHESVLADQDGGLRFVPDAVAAEEEVRSGEAVAAFFLPPTRVERIRAVIDHDRRLPQKSTYFWPKPRTGFVLRPLD